MAATLFSLTPGGCKSRLRCHNSSPWPAYQASRPSFCARHRCGSHRPEPRLQPAFKNGDSAARSADPAPVFGVKSSSRIQPERLVRRPVPSAAMASTPEPQQRPDLIEVALPLCIKSGQPFNPPILVSFREYRSEGNLPHMYQVRLVVSSIDGVPQDPANPPPIEWVLEGPFAAPLALRTGKKLWFMLGENGDLKFRPESEGHSFRFAVQMWTCWYDRPNKSWEREMYQGEIETGEISCTPAVEWSPNPESLMWDITQVNSVLENTRERTPRIVEFLRNYHLKITLIPDVLRGPWASPDKPSKRTG